MKLVKLALPVWNYVLIWVLGSGMLAPFSSFGAVEETFDVLQIGPQTYRNVTVTTKTGDYIFIMHSTGVANIKWGELPADIRLKLGYTGQPKGKAVKSQPTNLADWTKQSVASLHFPGKKDVETKWRALAPSSVANMSFNRTVVMAFLELAVVLYVLICYCSMLICKKTGNDPGPMVWIPVVQLVPLLKAAGMSPAWLLAFFIPALNVFAQIVWSINIAKARGKSAWVGFWLIVPVTSLVAYVYLALSGQPAKKEEKVVEIMTLEAA